MKKMQALAQDAICEEIALGFGKAAVLDADVFGFGELVYKYCNECWGEMEPNWDSIFPEITLDITTEFTIASAGAVEEPAWSKEEEER